MCLYNLILFYGNFLTKTYGQMYKYYKYLDLEKIYHDLTPPPRFIIMLQQYVHIFTRNSWKRDQTTVMSIDTHKHNKTRQVMYYNVILRRVRVTIVAVEKQDVLHILSTCTYFCLACPAWKSQSPYYIVICGLAGSTLIFRIISYMARFSENKILNI